MSSRALEMFKSGKGADCVIEVVPQIHGQDKQVFFFFFLLVLHSSQLYDIWFCEKYPS
jgi:hypothetical protein